MRETPDMIELRGDGRHRRAFARWSAAAGASDHEEASHDNCL